MDTYTYWYWNAKGIADDAGYKAAIGPENHINSPNAKKYALYYSHYHPNPRTGAHSLWGLPEMKL